MKDKRTLNLIGEKDCDLHNAEQRDKVKTIEKRTLYSSDSLVSFDSI